MFQMEKHLFVAAGHASNMLYHYVKNSKISMKDVAKHISLKENELEKKFMKAELSLVQLLDIVKYIEEVATEKLNEIKEQKLEEKNYV